MPIRLPQSVAVINAPWSVEHGGKLRGRNSKANWMAHLNDQICDVAWCEVKPGTVFDGNKMNILFNQQ